VNPLHAMYILATTTAPTCRRLSRPALTKLVKTKAPPTKKMRAKLEEAFGNLEE